MKLRKLATTVYGRIGTDWVRITLARLETSAIVWVRADGSDATVETMPSMFRTCGDMQNVQAKLAHRVNVAVTPAIGLENHEWKTAMTLEELAKHSTQGKALSSVLPELIATYAELAELDAAA